MVKGKAKKTGDKTHREAPQKKKKSWWRIALDIAALCAWILVAVIAVQYVVGYLMLGILGASEFGRPVWTAVYSAVVYVVALTLVIFVPLGLRRRREEKGAEKTTKEAARVKEKNSVKWKLEKVEMRMELGLSGLPTWTDVGLAPVGFIVSLIFAAGLVGLFSLFPWFNAEETQNVGFSLYMSGGDRIIAFITLVVMAPIAEEIIFRGWLYGKVRERLTGRMPDVAGMVISILIVSVLFGLVHMQWNVGVNVFALSVVLCALREITGTIYAGILTHMIKNGVAFFLLYVIGMG